MKILLSAILLFGLYSSLSAKTKKQMIQDIVGLDFKVDKIEKSHGDLYITYDKYGTLLYIDIKNKLVFYGATVLKRKNGKLVNLTRIDKEKYQKEIDKKIIKTIDMKKVKKIAVLDKVNGGDSKNSIVMFDSLSCPYCIKTDRFFKDNNYKLNVYRVYNKSGDIEDLLRTKFGVKNASKRLEDMDGLYRKYKILSTPNIFVIRNKKIIKIIKGANIKEIKKWIKK